MGSKAAPLALQGRQSRCRRRGTCGTCKYAEGRGSYPWRTVCRTASHGQSCAGTVRGIDYGAAAEAGSSARGAGARARTVPLSYDRYGTLGRGLSSRLRTVRDRIGCM